jgi:hypothetical protein
MKGISFIFGGMHTLQILTGLGTRAEVGGILVGMIDISYISHSDFCIIGILHLMIHLLSFGLKSLSKFKTLCFLSFNGLSPMLLLSTWSEN